MAGITFIVSFDYLMEKGVWEKFCEMKGINPHCVAEGLADKTESVELTPEEALEISLLDVIKAG